MTVNAANDQVSVMRVRYIDQFIGNRSCRLRTYNYLVCDLVACEIGADVISTLMRTLGDQL